MVRLAAIAGEPIPPFEDYPVNQAYAAVVNAKDGTIYQPPAPGSHIAYFDSGLLDYRLRSKLMVVNKNCAVGDTQPCDREFYVWENNRFPHLSHVPRETKKLQLMQKIHKDQYDLAA